MELYDWAKSVLHKGPSGNRKNMVIIVIDEADQFLKQQCIEDGMSRLRAWIVYKAVKWFGKKSAISSEEETKLFYAP